MNKEDDMFCDFCDGNIAKEVDEEVKRNKTSNSESQKVIEALGAKNNNELLTIKGKKVKHYCISRKVFSLILIILSGIMLFLRILTVPIPYIELYNIPTTFLLAIGFLSLGLLLLNKSNNHKIQMCEKCDAFINIQDIRYKLLSESNSFMGFIKVKYEFTTYCEKCNKYSIHKKTFICQKSKFDKDNKIKEYFKKIYNIKYNKNILNTANVNSTTSQYTTKKQFPVLSIIMYSLLIVVCFGLCGAQIGRVFIIYPNEYGYVYGQTAYKGYKEPICTTIKICDKAYTNNNNIKQLTIPDGVKSIGDNAFSGCVGLTKVNINSIENWCKINFVNKYSNPIYCAKELYLNNELITNLVIPDSVTSIGKSAFENCNSLTSVIIGDNVTSIGKDAFSGCGDLTSVIIGNNVTSIGDGAFWGCCDLTNITIPNSVTSIGSFAFSHCKNLTNITIPDSVISIREDAFSHCKNLTNLTISDSLISIADRTFFDCSGLTSITIPSSVTSIGEFAFSDCTGLTSITIPDSVTSIGKWAFDGCTNIQKLTCPTRAIQYIPQNSLQKVIINGGTHIEYNAFNHCKSLTSVIIGNSVISIADRTFFDCSGLTRITIPDSVISIREDAFSGCNNLTSVIIDSEAVANDYYNESDLFTNATEIYVKNELVYYMSSECHIKQFYTKESVSDKYGYTKFIKK